MRSWTCIHNELQEFALTVAYHGGDDVHEHSDSFRLPERLLRFEPH